MHESRQCIPEVGATNDLTEYLASPFQIGSLILPNRLVQGPLAGYSAAPFRQLYYQFQAPAYVVSEMISAFDVVHKHQIDSRYLYRAPEEIRLCYQLAGHDAQYMAKAARRLEQLGADLIDINCGCPKAKIRRKGAGSALLEKLDHLCTIVDAVRQSIQIPLTVKVRIHGSDDDIVIAKAIEQAGADALIVHGRHWTHDYDVPCNYHHLKQIKDNVRIPVIANGDILDKPTLSNAITISGCDAYMISRAGCGNPWLFQQLLSAHQGELKVNNELRLACFITHLQGLSKLECERRAVMQSKALVRYYFRNILGTEQLQSFYTLQSLLQTELYLRSQL
jgi:tRNA-dihydrouridine synthase B